MRPSRRFRGGERVAADIGQRPAARRVVTEGEGPLGIGHVVLAVETAVSANLAELAGRDHLLRKADHRVAEIVEPDLSLHASGLGRVRHLARVLRRRREGLLAMDMLARSDGRQRHLLVQRVGRGDVDRVDRGIGDHGPPVGRRVRETESVGGARGALFRDVGDGVQNRRHRQVEDLLRRGIAEDVRLPHEARADQADAERGLLRRARYQ